LKLDDLEETIAKFIPFGKLLDNINTNNRWIYKGSLTTPPCSKSIYWNVMATVYPIK
jgi:carbonic anhydrase